MRYAILSDIHGNIWALESVLEDVQRRKIDRFINLGDILYSPLKPFETYQLIKTIDAVTIQGNQDRAIYEAGQNQLGKNPTLNYIVSELGTEPVEWLRSLPKTATIDEDIFACHGTPTSDLVYLLENVASGHPSVRNDETIVRLLDRVESPIVLCGHTHIARVVEVSSGQIIVNPGSIGLPAYDDDAPNYHAMQNYSPLASYAIIEKGKRGWQVELVKVSYDFQAAVEQAQRQGRDDWAQWLGTGRGF